MAACKPNELQADKAGYTAPLVGVSLWSPAEQTADKNRPHKNIKRISQWNENTSAAGMNILRVVLLSAQRGYTDVAML